MRSHSSPTMRHRAWHVFQLFYSTESLTTHDLLLQYQRPSQFTQAFGEGHPWSSFPKHDKAHGCNSRAIRLFPVTQVPPEHADYLIPTLWCTFSLTWSKYLTQRVSTLLLGQFIRLRGEIFLWGPYHYHWDEVYIITWAMVTIFWNSRVECTQMNRVPTRLHSLIEHTHHPEQCPELFVSSAGKVEELFQWLLVM